MKRVNYKHYVRKAHRYFGIFIGIQFMFWTIGGLYFSWTDIREVRGDHLRKKSSHLSIPSELVSPTVALRNAAERIGHAEVDSLSVVGVLEESFYLIRFETAGQPGAILAGVKDGVLREPVTEAEARTIAASALANPADVARITYLTEDNVSGHHEYREKPLPAWAVHLKDGPTVYVSAKTGQLEAIRTDQWRLFDFLWMLHTMDFQGRDDINNYVLRGFSILGIITVISGFLLFFTSSRFVRGIIVKSRQENP